MMNLNLAANTTGIFALFSLAIALSPSLINIYKTSFKPKKILLQMARYGLLSSLCLGLIHGLLMTQQEHLNFYDMNTYWVYAGGLFTFNLLAFIAFTYTELKADLRKLSYFSCAVLFLLVCHVGQHL